MPHRFFATAEIILSITSIGGLLVFLVSHLSYRFKQVHQLLESTRLSRQFPYSSVQMPDGAKDPASRKLAVIFRISFLTFIVSALLLGLLLQLGPPLIRVQ